MGSQSFPGEQSLGQVHKSEGLRHWGVALGSSISKEEMAVGVGLSCVPGPHLPSPRGVAFTPCREGVG